MTTASHSPSESHDNLFRPILTQGKDSRDHSSELNQDGPEQACTAGNGEQSLREEHGSKKTEKRETQTEFIESFMEEAQRKARWSSKKEHDLEYGGRRE